MHHELNENIVAKPVEIFCGTGGVGKTTIATSRAVYLASSNKKVLLVTIDPAKRLKDILNLSNESAGIIETIDLMTLDQNLTGSMDALLMNPTATINYIIESSDAKDMLKNSIVKILAKPYGGMNEILSIVELRKHLKSKKYDVIVLDTPPGKHFIDFLNACRKINLFFDNSFIEMFRYLKKPTKASTGILATLVSSGARKILGYLEKFTGKNFVEQFIDAVYSIHAGKKIFIDAVSFSDQLKDVNTSNWFLVTSADHNKTSETTKLTSTASSFLHKDSFIILNRSTEIYFSDKDLTNNDFEVAKLIKSIIEKENIIYNDLTASGKQVLRFSEVLTQSPRDHVVELTNQW